MTTDRSYESNFDTMNQSMAQIALGKRLLFFGLGAALLSFEAGISEADTVLDQRFLSSPIVEDGGIGSGHYGAPIITQTFTVGRGGMLSAVGIPLTSLNLPSILTAAIYETSGPISTFAQLGSASVDGATLPSHWLYPFDEAELTNFDFRGQNIAVTAGDQLALVLTATESFAGASGAYYYYGSGYTGGNFVVDIGTGPISFFPFSIYFETFVDTNPVPEPSSVAVFFVSGAGLVLCVCLRHFAKHYATSRKVQVNHLR